MIPVGLKIGTNLFVMWLEVVIQDIVFGLNEGSVFWTNVARMETKQKAIRMHKDRDRHCQKSNYKRESHFYIQARELRLLLLFQLFNEAL